MVKNGMKTRDFDKEYENDLLIYGYACLKTKQFYPYYLKECHSLNAIFWKSDSKITLMFKY